MAATSTNQSINCCKYVCLCVCGCVLCTAQFGAWTNTFCVCAENKNVKEIKLKRSTQNKYNLCIFFFLKIDFVCKELLLMLFCIQCGHVQWDIYKNREELTNCLRAYENSSCVCALCTPYVHVLDIWTFIRIFRFGIVHFDKHGWITCPVYINVQWFCVRAHVQI